ncbi:MAG TPA: IgGFc-binding protein [Labilithrix sp.]|nr:IgGFc-binding protein [Labilithrix sp.]
MIRFAPLVFGTGLTALGFAACTNDRSGFTQKREIFVEPDAEPPPAQPVCGFRCSRDLKKVLKGCDGSETEVMSCPPEQGCGVDKCIDACESAALSKGSIGCSFWTLPPDDSEHGAGACFAAMVANTWDRPVSITAEWGREALDISQSIFTAKKVGDNPTYTPLTGPLPPGEVAIVFLAEATVVSDEFAVRCPEGVTAAVTVDPINHGTTKTKAFHLKTDAPVSAYSSFPYGGAESYYPSSTLLLPVSSWDSRYIAVSTGKFGDAQSSSTERRTIQIVANEDDTHVSMRPNVTIDEGKDVPPVGEGEVSTWTLSRGQVLQITQRGGVTGSPISSNKPVGLFGGAPCLFLPSGVPTCDVTQQQIPPFSQWGTEYALVPFSPRIQSVTGKARETVPWTFVGAVDGTVLTYEPRKPPGAPEAIGAGQAVYFMTDQLVTVKSQDSKHPFYAAVQMSSSGFGGGAPGGGRTPGDPDFVNLVPTDQFLDHYVFFADYTYPDTILTVVRRKSANGFAPVELGCGGEIEGFAPLGSSGEYEYAWVRLTAGSVPQKLAKGECGYGRHEARSDAPFAITVWGIAQDASYGYAGGMGSRPVNDAPPPIVN